MSVDINATDFVQKFDIKDGTVGIVGHGWDSDPPWADELSCADRYRSEPEPRP